MFISYFDMPLSITYAKTTANPKVTFFSARYAKGKSKKAKIHELIKTSEKFSCYPKNLIVTTIT